MHIRTGRNIGARAGLVGLVLGVMLAFAPAAQAQSSCVDYLYDINLYLACSGGPAITVTPSSSTPGGQITTDLTGWLPGSTVTITITCNGVPITLGNVTIGANATGSGTFTVPSDCPLGPQVVTGTGPDMLGVVVSREGPVVLQAAVTTTTAGGGGGGNTGGGGGGGGGAGSGGTGSLPPTGSSTGRLVTIGAALIVIGASALYGSTRSRRSTKVH